MLKTIEEQKKALDALHYELWMHSSGVSKILEMNMFRETHHEKLSDEFQLNYNMCLESCLTHVCNLVHFLEDQIRDTDIRCSDFGINGVDVRLPDGNQLGDISKYLSHLTWRRTETNNGHQWYFRDIRNELNNKFRVFIDKCESVPGLFPTMAGREIAIFRSLM